MALNYQGLSPIENEGVSAVTATNSVDLGTCRTHNGEDYVYAYNDGAGQIVPGQGVVMSGNTGFSVCVSSTTFFNVCVGVVKHVTFTTATYGWLLTRGFSNVKMGDNASGVVGEPLYLGASGCFNGVAAKNTLSTAFSQITSLYGLQAVGVCVQATASAGTGYAFLKCFGN